MPLASPSDVKRSLTEDEFADLLRPRLHLFLSADIVGSTRFKQRSSKGSLEQAWLPSIFEFLHEFPFEVEKAVAAESDDKCTPPKVWKLLGDEVILSTEVQRGVDLGVLVNAFAKTIKERNHSPRNRTESREPLRIKGAAWVAGFPVANAILPLANGGHDYLGASMDTGFRIARVSTPRRMAISVELAWMLLAIGDPHPTLGYHGRSPLDGLIVEGGYPAFFVDIGPTKLEELEDRIVCAPDFDSSAMRDFSRAFIESHGRPNHLPFIRGDHRFGVEPATFPSALDRIAVDLRKDVFNLDEEPAAPVSSGTETHSAKQKLLEEIDRHDSSEDDSD